MALFAFTFMAAAADVNGKYTGEMTTQRGPQTVTFTFKTTGATVEGTTTGRGGETPIEAGKIDGDKLTFTVTRPGRNGGDPMKIQYTGKISGDSIELSYDQGRGPVTVTLKKAM
jgi:hypothetical protein